MTLIKKEEYIKILPENVEEEIEERVYGIAFLISKEDKKEIFKILDHREKDGYSRYTLDFYTNQDDQEPSIKNAITFVATTKNIRFCGYHHNSHISKIIHQSKGPSGSNREYLEKLYNSLQIMGVKDNHISSLYNHLILLDKN